MDREPATANTAGGLAGHESATNGSQGDPLGPEATSPAERPGIQANLEWANNLGQEAQQDARGMLARGLSRLIAVDGESLSGLSVGPEEEIARLGWVARTVEALERAPTLDSFRQAILDRVQSLDDELPEEQGLPSREAFKQESGATFSLAALLIEKNPHGAYAWQALDLADPAGSLKSKQRLGREINLAKRTAKLASASRSGLADDGLSMQKRELMERFGFCEISFDGPPKPAAEQSLLLDQMAKVLERGARELGLDFDNAVGLAGGWSLRVMDQQANDLIFNRAAYVDRIGGANPILALAPTRADPYAFKHEWTHMLDARLGSMVREEAQQEGQPAWLRAAVESETFFSCMPQEAQRLLPQAFEGYWQIAAAAQGLDDGASLRSVASDRVEKLEALACRAQTRLLANPLLMAGLSEEARAHLDARIKDDIKILLTASILRPAVAPTTSPGDESMEDSASLDHLGDPLAHEALERVAQAFEDALGPSWRTGRDGFELPATSQLLLGLACVGRAETEAIHELASMKGANGMPLSPQSPFAQASRQADLDQGSPGYWDASHEMLARAIGRPSALKTRVASLGNLKRLASSIAKIEVAGEWSHKISQDSYAPELDAKAQRQIQEGFSKMTSAAGLGPARMRMGALEWAERAMLSSPGRLVMDGAQDVARTILRVDASFDQAIEACLAFVKKAFFPAPTPQPAARPPRRPGDETDCACPNSTSAIQSMEADASIAAISSKLEARRAKVCSPASSPAQFKL